MAEDVSSRLTGLIKKGEELIDDLEGQGDDAWIDDAAVATFQTWVVAAGDLLLVLGGPQSDHFSDFRKIVFSQRNPVGLKTYVVRRTFELLLGVLEEWSKGELKKYEDIVAATVFDDFLDDAETHHDAGHKAESAALAAAVFGHALRAIAGNHGVVTARRSVSEVVAALTEQGVFDAARGAEVQGYARLQSDVVSARASEIDAAAIGDLIDGTRKLLQEFM